MALPTPTQSESVWDLRLLVRVVLSAPILLGILLVAVTAVAEEIPTSAEHIPPAETLAPRALEPEPVPAPRTRILGLDVFAMRGSLVEDRSHHESGYTSSWGRGPRAGQRTLGLAWGWRF